MRCPGFALGAMKFFQAGGETPSGSLTLASMEVAQDRVPTVLVVEDQTLMRMQVATELSDAGFRVLEAPTADEALRLLESGPPIGVLFTDVQMPGCYDGLSLARLAIARWPHLGVLVTSGLSQPVIPLPARFIAKPYHIAKVIFEIDRLLGSFRC
jgi:two-component system, response regulator PdtaR